MTPSISPRHTEVLSENAVVLRSVRADWLQSLRQKRDTMSVADLPLRLLFVSTSWGNGGIERHSVYLAKRLMERGAIVTYACCAGGTLDWLCGKHQVNACLLTTCNSGDLLSAFRLTQIILRHEINVVHVHSRKDFVPAVLAVACARVCKAIFRKRLVAKKFLPTTQYHSSLPVLILHSHLLKQMGFPVWLSGRLFARGAHKVVAVSEAVRRYLIATHQLPPAFVSTVYNGINLDEYLMAPQIRSKLRKLTRQKWAIPDNALVIGMVGRLGAKGQNRLLQAVSCLLECCPTLRIMMVGPEGEIGDLLRLQQDAERAGLISRVIFTGQSENVPALLASMDILVHLPADEAFGLVLVEAMAAGLPVVATDTGGCREIIEDGVTGLLIDVNSNDRISENCALAEALVALLSPEGAELRRRMGKAGQRRVQNMFSVEQQIEKLEVLYQRLLSNNGDLL